MAPIITVLMAVYNGEKSIKRTIDSIMSQTFKDFEFLIINDCSTDSTISIISSYSDNRIRLYTNEKNIGQVRSLNYGLSLAKGQYIARMDADDYAFSIWLERQYQFISTHPQYSVVSTDCKVVDTYGNSKGTSRGAVEFQDIIMNMFTGTPINHVSVIMNRDHILAVNGYNAQFKICADFDLWSRLIGSGYKITTLNEHLCSYTVSAYSYAKTNTACIKNEKAIIIRNNANVFSSYHIDEQTARHLASMFYDGLIDVSYEDIARVELAYENIIRNLKPDFAIKLNRKRLKAILLKNYWLSAYHYTQQGRNRQARSLMALCIRRHGLNLYSVAILIATFLSPELTEKINRLRAKYLT